MATIVCVENEGKTSLRYGVVDAHEVTVDAVHLTAAAVTEHATSI
jgi:hypothetical protein